MIFALNVHSYTIVTISLAFILLINIDLVGLSQLNIVAAQQPSFTSSGVKYDSNAGGGPSDNKTKKLGPPALFILGGTPTPPALTDEQGQETEKSINETLVSPKVPLSNETIGGPEPISRTPINNTESDALVQNKTTTGNMRILESKINSNVPTIDAKNNTSSLIKNKNISDPIRIIINKTVTPGKLSLVDEPSQASNGPIVFYTGNKYSASSKDNGTTWRYIDPTNDPMDKHICCDQDVIYDPHHDIFIWYRQGAVDNNGENFIALGISSDLKNWTFYGVKPTDIDSTWTKQWFDYPQLALANKHLYITTNIQRNVEPAFLGFKIPVHTLIIRISLDDLKRRIEPEFDYYQDSSGAKSFAPVQGATDTMYWAAHLSNNLTRIYEWDESLPWTSVIYYDRHIPAWSVIRDGNGQCPTGTNNSSNWCKRANSFLNMQGWVSGDIVGFIWPAGQGGESTHNATFNWPYINAAIFNRTTNMAYLGRPYIWSPDFAWLYGYVMPNKNGDLGIMAFFGGGDIYPSLGSRHPSFWRFY